MPTFKGVAITEGSDSIAVARDVAFAAVKLHDRSRFCWAVIGSPSGAIATAARGGPLLMRLCQDEAERLATSLTIEATIASTEH